MLKNIYSPNKTARSKLPELHVCYSKAKYIWILKFEKFHFWDRKKNNFGIITHISNAHKYIADTETMFLVWPHTGLRKYNYYAA